MQLSGIPAPTQQLKPASMLRYQKVQQAISGLVLDSAPSYMRLSSLHRATTLVLQPRFPAWAGLLVTLMVWLLCVGVATVSLVRDGAFPPRAVQYWCGPGMAAARQLYLRTDRTQVHACVPRNHMNSQTWQGGHGCRCHWHRGAQEPDQFTQACTWSQTTVSADLWQAPLGTSDKQHAYGRGRDALLACRRSWLEGMKPGVPELYLYSSADELTDWSQLQHLIATRRDRCLCLSSQSCLEACEGSMHPPLHQAQQ